MATSSPSYASSRLPTFPLKCALFDPLTIVQEEYEESQKVTGAARIMTKGDLKLYAICG